MCIACTPLKLKRPNWIYSRQVIVLPHPTITSPTQKPGASYHEVRQILVPHCHDPLLIRPPYAWWCDLGGRLKFEFTDGVPRCSSGLPKTNKRFARRETTLTIYRRISVISGNISERFTRITASVSDMLKYFFKRILTIKEF